MNVSLCGKLDAITSEIFFTDEPTDDLTDSLIEIVIKAFARLNKEDNKNIREKLLNLQYTLTLNSRFGESIKWTSIAKSINAFFCINRYLFTPEIELQSKINKHFIEIKSDFYLDSDLQKEQWITVVEEVSAALNEICFPGITSKEIEKFKNKILEKKMLKIEKGQFSVKCMQDIMKKNFAIGHLSITRGLFDPSKIYEKLGKELLKHSEKTEWELNSRENGDCSALLINPQVTSSEKIEEYKKQLNKISIKLIERQNKIIPIIKIPSFIDTDGNFAKELHAVKATIGRNYESIILDLTQNEGGHIFMLNYFLSLFLGNNDPDICPINNLNKINVVKQNLSHVQLEQVLKKFLLPPFYEYMIFINSPVEIKKDAMENITFKKMIVLIDEATFSAGEYAAACLKNTLGSRVCVLGMPGRGSFEHGGGKHLKLSHNFVLCLPGEDSIFFSKKFQKLLTGQRLLPDIVHENKETIINKALEILHQEISWPETPSYEFMLEKKNFKKD